MFNSNLNSLSCDRLENYAYICNYIKNYEPQVLESSSSQLIHFYNHKIDSELRPIFINLLPNFLVSFTDEWKEILNLNWREGRKDLSTAALQTLLKLDPPNELFLDNLILFERIDSLHVLTDVLLAAPANNNTEIFSIFRDRICIAASEDKVSIKRSKSNCIINTSNAHWTEQWSRVIQLKRNWPLSSFNSIHPIDLLSKLALSALNSDKSTFKSFYSSFCEVKEDEILVSFLSELIPNVINQCTWLYSILPRPLLNLFSHLLKACQGQEVLLSLCRLFMDCKLGTCSRKLFVNYLAAHVEDEQIGEKCLNLIESFVERFPESRYVCLSLVKSLLDGVDKWEPHLLVPFYSSFALMACTSDSVMNDLILLLKKQIYSSDLVYKRIGARGVGIFLARNGSADRIKAHEKSLLPDPDDTFNDVDMASCSQKPRDISTVKPVKCDYNLRIIISLLEETVKSLKLDSESMLIFLNYVNESFDNLDDELKDWIGDWSRTVFQSSFIRQVDEELYAYKYDQDEDNPLAVDFSNSSSSECGPILLSLMGKYEKYQNNGNLEGIDALKSCSIQFINENVNGPSAADLFHVNFIILNYFRTILNTFQDDSSRFSVIVELQKEFASIFKSKPTYFSEFKLFPECKSLLNHSNSKTGDKTNISLMSISSTSSSLSSSNDPSVPSLLDELLLEILKPENRINGRNTNASPQSSQLNETNFKKSLVPLEISFIQNLLVSSPQEYHNEILWEIDLLIEFYYKNDLESQRKLLDCLLGCSRDHHHYTSYIIDIVMKCQRESISSSKKEILLKLCKRALEGPENHSVLIQKVCKFLIEFLKCPEIISGPIDLIKTYLTGSRVEDDTAASASGSSVISCLLTIPNLNFNCLIQEIKNEKIDLKNRITLLKGFGKKYSKELKNSSIEECQEIFSNWSEIIQAIRSSNSLKLLKWVVKESHVMIECFLSSNSLKRIEQDSLLLLDGLENTRNSILLLFKTVQQSTRSLQIICNHLKYTENVKGSANANNNNAKNSNNSSNAINSSIPNLKKSLESLIFKVKEILTRSGCLNAFWMGNLKHRDLEGKELSSQVELLRVDGGKDSDSESDSESESEGLVDNCQDSDDIEDHFPSESFIIDSNSDITSNIE